MTCGIYRILNNVNGKGYVGHSRDLVLRWRDHRSELRGKYHDNDHLQAAWNKYGEEAFLFEVLEECSKELLKERELFWVGYYNTLDRAFGYNIEIPTDPPIMAEETKKKISISRTGKGMGERNYMFGKTGDKNPIFGKRGSECANYGCKHSAEARERKSLAMQGIGNNFYGKKHTDVTLKNISGENSRHSKLDWAKVMEIRSKYASGEYSLSKLGTAYGVAVGTIQCIVENRTWKIKG
jgi:group I intron endonuclease